MGIDGLLRLLKPITQRQHISSFKDQRVGIDMMPWIYRGCYSCNYELAQNIASMKFLYYPLEMIEILHYYNIKPIFVFDGRSINMKNDTNERRKKEKQQNKEKGLKFLEEGNLEDARKYLSRCIFLDERIICTTLNVLKTKNIEFLVAPFEADCQIAKLKKEGLIDVAISEDSDLLAYGVNTILKLNQNGDCDYVDPSKWRPRDVDSSFLKEYLSMSHVNRIEAAVLAGSDYNQSIKGIGIKRAVRLLYKQANMKNVINKLKFEKAYAEKIPENYEQLAIKSKLVFLFATVYNPNEKRLEFLNPDLLQEFKPEQLTLEQLSEIVGVPYPEYLEYEVYAGKCDSKELKERNFQPINFRQIFNVKKQQLLLQQSSNRKRREQYNKMKAEREKQIEEGVIVDKQMKPGHQIEKKIIKNKSELTEEEKEQKKKDRKQRIVKLHDVMNSFMHVYNEEEAEGQEEQEEEEEEEIIESHSSRMERSEEEDEKKEKEIIAPEKMKEIQSEVSKIMNALKSVGSQSKMEETPEKQSESEQQIQEQQSQSYDLAFLNPFAKQKYELNGSATKSPPSKKMQK